jgi:hypothetical protein
MRIHFLITDCDQLAQRYPFFLNSLSGGGVQLGPLGTAATDWPIVAAYDDR